MNKLLFNLLVCISLIFSTHLQSSESEKNNLDFVEAEVIIQKYQFIPEILTIKVGQTVKWINKEKRQYHSVWFEKTGDKESDYLFPDDVFTKRFDTVGEYEYRCGPHPEMIAKIIVK